MSRKAAFSPKRPKANSSEHNSRKEIPNYLLENDPMFSGNFYEKIPSYENDEQFIELAKKIYNEKFIERVRQNQKMQKKQADALLWEVAISTEDHHTKEDILALFKMLKNEKSEENESKRELGLSRLKPMSKKPVHVLPLKLRIKRKPKKENFGETGYHILELSEHRDEGHFIRKAIWENLSYYPGRDIFLKEDGNWYIKSKELNEDKSEDAFDVLADMTEFEKVYNYHWHVKYTNFNIDTGLSAQFTKGEVSGKGRLKKVAEFLNLDYDPEEKTPFAQGVKTIKEQHHIDRQNKYLQLIMKFGHEVEMKIAQEKVSKREEVLAKKITNARLTKKSVQKLEEGLVEKDNTILLNNQTIEILKSKNSVLSIDTEEKEAQIISDAITLKDNQVKIEFFDQEIKKLEKDVFSEERTEVDQNGNECKSKNIDLVRQLEKENEILKCENNSLIINVEHKETQIMLDAKLLKDSQDKIETLEKLLEPTGYVIEGESVSKKLCDYVEGQRHTLNYKSSRVDSLEEKLDFQKERVEARNKLMNEERIRHERVEKEFVVKEEAQNMQIQELKKDVFSETWTRKDKNGVKHKSKNINVVKQLEKNNKKLNDQIKTLELLAYSKSNIPVEFDENDKPIKFEKEPWKEKAEHAEEEAINQILENEKLVEKILELGELAYYDDQIWDPEIGDFSCTETSYKEKNEILEKELDEAKKIIETMRDYDVPISQLGEFWDELKITVLDTPWEKREESVENEILQDDIKIEPRKEKIEEDKIKFPSFKR